MKFVKSRVLFAELKLKESYGVEREIVQILDDLEEGVKED